MTKNQFLLLKLAEECAEVAQRCSKQIQFGKDECQHDQDSNKTRLRAELLDLLAVASLLTDEEEISTIDIDDILKAAAAKKEKMQKYLLKSFLVGQLPEIIL